MEYTVTTKEGTYKIQVPSITDARHWVINHCDLSDTTITITKGWNK